jgi:hypothetical protein
MQPLCRRRKCPISLDVTFFGAVELLNGFCVVNTSCEVMPQNRRFLRQVPQNGAFAGNTNVTKHTHCL